MKGDFEIEYFSAKKSGRFEDIGINPYGYITVSDGRSRVKIRFPTKDSFDRFKRELDLG